jgi:hypothetical protein
MNALNTLKQALESAPKSKAGFVNWTRNKNLQAAAVKKMVDEGVPEPDAKLLAWNVGRHFDTIYRNHPDR